MPRYFIKTFGCQMNVNDSEILAGILEQNGYAPAADPNTADIILVNTCSIRQKAENKAYAFLNEIKKLKKSDPALIIGLCGCVAQQEKEKIVEKFPFLDLVVGSQGIDTFSSLLEEVCLARDVVQTKKSSDSTGVQPAPVFSFAESLAPRPPLPTRRARSPRAHINIMYGCNNFCSYCVVPYVRGREVCRPMKDILAEIRALDKSIYKEVILLGQNVNSWREGVENSTAAQKSHPKTLADLLHEVSKIDGVEWISFMTSHPKDLGDDIIDAIATLPKVNKYIHLPIQSGSTKILKAMNRRYTRSAYLRLVKKIYTKIPEVALTSDIIVGFPGETETDFNDSLDMVRRANFDSVNTAAFSPRPGTAAIQLPRQIPIEIKKARLQKIMEAVEDVALQKNRKLIGRVMPVLVEGYAKDGRLSGRTRTNKIVYFTGPKKLIYQIVPVKISMAKSWVLGGELAET